MKILLSTIGSRGEVQPLLALALELRELGHDATLCAPPNFKDWVESYGLRCVPIGPDVRALASAGVKSPAHRAPAAPSRERRGHRLLWKQDARSFNDVFLAALNDGREKCGLEPVVDVRSHVFADGPWLCADPVLAPLSS